jgi:spermidine/putrescine transport system permease protein
MRALVTAVYVFLYAPIALVVLFSFNAGRSASEFTGFSVLWYGRPSPTASCWRPCRTA